MWWKVAVNLNVSCGFGAEKELALMAWCVDSDIKAWKMDFFYTHYW